MSLINNLRDKTIESIIRNNEWVQKFAEIKFLTLNSELGTVDVIALLHGEREPLRFRGYYKIKTENENSFIQFYKITCEREWINNGLELFLEQKELKFPLPKMVNGLAKIFL